MGHRRVAGLGPGASECLGYPGWARPRWVRQPVQVHAPFPIGILRHPAKAKIALAVFQGRGEGSRSIPSSPVASAAVIQSRYPAPSVMAWPCLPVICRRQSSADIRGALSSAVSHPMLQARSRSVVMGKFFLLKNTTMRVRKLLCKSLHT
jgi:hypothetical protein